MAKFYTCRAVVKPEYQEPAKRLCLAPTVDGLHCQAHVEKQLSVTSAIPTTVEEQKIQEQRRRVPFWPLNDDGTPCRVGWRSA